MKAIAKGEYAELMCRYFQGSFPKIATISKPSLLEILTHIMLGTKDTRYGSAPKPESQVVIRQTLARAIELNAPIPILVPWGGRKADPNLSVDVAEVSTIKQLLDLDTLIKQFHKPGLHIHIRIEDTGASWIYRTQDSEGSIEKYSSDMVKLVNLLKGDTEIEPIRESLLMDKDVYFKASEMYSELLEVVIAKQLAADEAKVGLDLKTIPEYVDLLNKGWKGEINANQRDYYISRYKKLYPNLTDEHYVLMLSDYLGGSKARYDLKGRAEPDSSVSSHIQITFVEPIPGAPMSLFSNTLYYRTVPASMGRTHAAPWRAKGYLRIMGDDVIPKLVHGSDVPNLETAFVKLVDDEDEDNYLMVQADYVVFDMMPIYAPMGM